MNSGLMPSHPPSHPAFIVALALGILALAAAPVWALPLTLNPDTAAPGTPIQLLNLTFQPDQVGKIRVTFTGVTEPTSVSVGVDPKSLIVIVPQNAHAGTLKVTLDGAEIGTADFKMPPPATTAGAACKPLEFNFKLVGSRTISLLVTSDAPGTFEIVVKPLPPSKGKALSSCGGPTREFFKTERTVAVGVTEIAFPVLSECDLATVLNADGLVEVSYKCKDKDPCREKADGKKTVLLLEQHRLTLDVGSVFALETGGSWKSNPELAVNATSRLHPRWRGIVDIRYSAIGAIASPTSTPSVTPTPTPSPATTPTPSPVFNPFTSSGGIVRADFSLLYATSSSPAPMFNIVGGFGFTTVPGQKLAKVDARARFLGGGRLEVRGYNAGQPADSLSNSNGYFQVAVAWDDLWRWEEVVADKIVHHQDPWRVVTQGQLELPQIGGEYLRLSLRLVADIPISRNNTFSDIRISALATLDPKIFRSLFGVGGVATASK